MMYRLILNIFIPEDVPLDRIRERIVWLRRRSVTINPSKPNEEHSKIDLHLCHHDDEYGPECRPLYSWESP